jgi:hypothetical protein
VLPRRSLYNGLPRLLLVDAVPVVTAPLALVMVKATLATETGAVPPVTVDGQGHALVAAVSRLARGDRHDEGRRHHVRRLGRGRVGRRPLNKRRS